MAIGLGARRFAERHLDGFAILKAMGLTQRVLARTLMLEMLWLALAGGALGVILGWVAHHALTGVARVMLETSLPAASAWPALQALLVAVVLVLGFAAVPVLRLAGVTPLRVLRRDLGAPGLSVWLVLIVALGAFSLLLFWLVGEARLSLLALGGFVVAGLAFVLLAMCGVWLAARLRPKRTRGGWALVLRLALTGWSRRLSMTAVQIVALTIGLMALLLLTVVRNDLLAAWQQAAPPDAPNRFVINIQPDQQADVRRMLAEAGLGEVPLYPMVRGRPVAINDRPVRPQDYPDDRAQRLVDREFNLSYTDRMPGHNRLAAGRWIRPQAAEVSAEVGIMNTLGLKLGDHLRFDVAGQPVEMTLVGSRELKWDSMQVNFFMIGSPAALATQPQSLITSFHLPPGREGLVRQLTRAMSNLTIVDTSAITAQIQTMIGQVVQAVQFLFLFTLAAGCVVLYAAMGSVRDERVAEVALMRALGASRRQLGFVQLLELSLTGLLAGLMGAAGATLLGWLLAREVFDFAYQPSLWLLSGSILASMLFIVLAGGWNIWRLLDTPPLRALRGA
ncbi:FtsX-like permease family protein [Lautropia mirabilis]